MYAISPRGAGKPVGARCIADAVQPLAEGETFVVPEWSPDLVLAANGASLRKASAVELTDLVAEFPSLGTRLETHKITFTPPALTSIPFDVFVRRIRTEGLFDKFSDIMRSTPARNRIWDEWRTLRDPIPKSSQQARGVLSDAAVGATQAQIDRIMA